MRRLGVDFGALQARLGTVPNTVATVARARPAVLMVFDLLRHTSVRLVGHLTGISPLFHELESASDWFACTGSGSAEWMAALIRSLSTGVPSAAPLEGCRICIPCAGSGLQPLDQLRRVGRRLTAQCTAGQDSLDGRA